MVCPVCGGTVHGAACKLCEMFAAQVPPGGTLPGTWPQVSAALGASPADAAALAARNRRHGVNVGYDARGRAVIPDRGERKKLLKLEGMHDNDGGYGD